MVVIICLGSDIGIIEFWFEMMNLFNLPNVGFWSNMPDFGSLIQRMLQVPY